jgi:anhydro-N-acetylmuramic acid kinase
MSPPSSGHDRRRSTVGLFVGPDLRRVTGAIIAAHGVGFDARADVAATASARISPHTRRLFRELARGRRGRPPALVSVLAAELADAQAACVHKLAVREPMLGQRALCVAVADPGLWREETCDDRSCLSLCDGARLAELSGMNVLDAFAARDLAQRGRGGPLLPTPYWLLLRRADRPRVVVHLDATTEITLLPPSRDATALDQVGAASIGIGPGMLGLLARRVHWRGDNLGGPAPAANHDPRSRDARSGEARPELIAAWSADPAVQPALADVWRGSASGLRPAVDAMLQTIRTMQIPAADALRTMTLWIAQLIAARVSGPLSSGPRSSGDSGELLLAGPGRKHTLLRADLLALLPGAKLLDDVEIGCPIAALDAAATAWWGQLYLDQTPGNLPALTGANSPRVLGRFTPGAPRNFLQLVRAMAGGQPVVSLGAAI